MAKVAWKPGTMIYPLPAVLVSCGNTPENYNLITVSWTGTISSDPPMCYISVRKERHSHAILMETKEFAINLTNKSMAKVADWCGVKSGKKVDKFKETNLTPGKAINISAPIIEESPLSIECKIVEVKELGSHDMFIAEVVGVLADDKYLDAKTGQFRMDKAELIAYSHGYYYEIGKMIGRFGYSVMKTKTQKKQQKEKANKKKR